MLSHPFAKKKGERMGHGTPVEGFKTDESEFFSRFLAAAEVPLPPKTRICLFRLDTSSMPKGRKIPRKFKVCVFCRMRNFCLTGYPGSPNAGDPGRPSLVEELNSLPRRPGHPKRESVVRGQAGGGKQVWFGAARRAGSSWLEFRAGLSFISRRHRDNRAAFEEKRLRSQCV